MVRHIIDEKSPVYGHTMESLCKGDASFSLTVMGMERTSMQPVFHLEVCVHILHCILCYFLPKEEEG